MINVINEEIFQILFKLKENDNEQWKNALTYLGTIPELNYLTQIVIMLYEDTSVDVDSDKRFHVELHFSPGAYADFDAPTDLIKTNLLNEQTANDSLKLASQAIQIQEKLSPTQSDSSLFNINKSKTNNQKKSPFSYAMKRFPIKKFNKELQTLTEPNEAANNSIETDSTENTGT